MRASRCSITDAPKKGELLFTCNGRWRRRRAWREAVFNSDNRAAHALETENFILIPPVRMIDDEAHCGNSSMCRRRSDSKLHLMAMVRTQRHLCHASGWHKACCDLECIFHMILYATRGVNNRKCGHFFLLHI